MKTLYILPAVALVAIAGCERKTNRVEPTFDDRTAGRDLPPKNDDLAVGGGPIALNNAVDKIVEARCDRELKCANVGADKKFADRAACSAAVKKSLADELNAEDCPAGIDTKELDECLHESRNEDCKNPFDKVGRLAACRTSDLCRHVK
jgi:hypothetical protein